MPNKLATTYKSTRFAELIYKSLRGFLSSSPIAVSTFQTSLIYVLRLAIQSGSLILLGNLLGAEQFALFAAIAATALILGSCTNLGMNLLLLKEASNNEGKQQEILSYALPSVLLAGFTALLMYILIGLSIFDFGVNQIEALLAIGAAEIVIAPLIALISAIHLAARRAWLSQLLPTLQNLLRLAVIVLLLAVEIESPLDFYLYSYAPTSILVLLLASITIANAWPPLSEWRMPKRSELKESTGFGSLNLMHIASAEVDKTLVIKLIPATSAGMYVIGMRIIGAFVLPINALLISATPRLFRKNQDNRSLIKWLFVVTLSYGLIASGTIWAGADVIEHLFREDYSGLGSILSNMCLIIPGLVLKLAASNIFMTQKSAWYRVYYEIINIVMLVALFNFLGATYGLQGIIFAVACTEWTMGLTGWLFIFILKTTPIRESEVNG